MNRFVRSQRDLQGKPFLAALVFSLFFLVSSWSYAQLSTASINGQVRDPKGASVPGATITLHNVDTAVENTTVSNGSGSYLFVSITPGNYTMKISASGFNPQTIPQFTLTVGQVATVDFPLTVGSQSSTVTVEGSAPQLEVSNANLGTVIGAKQVNDLPLNGRNFTQLLQLTPGVAPVSRSQNSGGGFTAPTANGSSFSFPAINGQRNRSNFFLTDGLNNFGSFLSTYAVPPIIDAIQEFKVVSHTDSAEFGSVEGGVVNVVTKSGTNEFHGTGWEYARNAIFDARTYFLPTTAKKAAFSQNQFGGSIGGPVWIPKLYNGKNKTFFFGAYQGFRYLLTNNSSLKVPTPAELAGDESTWPTQIYNPFTTRANPAVPGTYLRDPFPGNIIPKNLIDPTMIAYEKFVLPAAGPVFDANGDNAIDTTPTTQTENEFNVRVDQKIGANDSAFFRYSFINDNVVSSGGVPGLPSSLSIPGRNWGGSYVHVFSPSLIAQVQYARTTVQNLSNTRFAASTSGIFSQVGFAPAFAGNFTAAANGNLIPSIGIANYTSVGESVNNTTKATDSNQYYGSLTKTLASHELRFGAGYISSLFASPISYANLGFAAQQTADTNPNDTVNKGDPIASFILNVPDNANRRNVNEATRPGGVFSAFGQDTWRASNKLTINIGLRYDLTLIPPYGTNATIGEQGGIETGDSDLYTGQYIIQKLPPACTVRGHAPCIPGNGQLPAHVIVDPRGKIAHNTYNNFGPRFGFAYRVSDRLVARGAFGIVYDNWAGISQTAQNIEGSWPDIGQQIANNLNQPTTASAVPTVKAQDPFGNGTSSLFPAPTPFNQVNWFYDPHMKNSYSQQYNFGIEQLLNQSLTMTANYVGSVSKRLDIGGYYNTALTPGPGDPQARAPYTYITPTFFDRSAGTANYNAFQFTLDKRYTNGLSYQVAYTWAKAINFGADGWFGSAGSNPTDPYHPSAYGNRSVAGFDVTNDLTINTIYQVPVGKGKEFSTGHNVLDHILGDWQINNIFLARSGLPFTPIISSDVANTGNVGWAGYEHANLVGNPNNISKRTANEFFNTKAYVSPPAFTFGTSGRYSLRSNGYWDLDSSLFREFPIGGGRQFQFQAQAFNLFNNVVLGTPNSDLNAGTAFGTVNGTANNSREIQLGAKFIF